TGGSAVFNDKTVGEDKEVTASGMVLSGPDARNYSLTSVGTTNSDTTALDTDGNFTANNKTYDGDAVAQVWDQTLNGVLGSDDVTSEGRRVENEYIMIEREKLRTKEGMV